MAANGVVSWSLDKAHELFGRAFSEEKGVSEILSDDESVKSDIHRQFEMHIVSEMQGRFKKRESEKEALTLAWRLNINFYNGFQFTEIDQFVGDVFTTPRLTEYEERKVFNEIAANIEARQAVLSKRRNNMKNRPASTSSEDRSSAMIGNRVLASTKRRLGMNDLQTESNLMAGVTGTAVWKTVWDSSAGITIGIAEYEADENDIKDDILYSYEKQLLGMSVNTVFKKIKEGDVLTTMHSPFEIFPENVAVPIRNQRRVMHVVLCSPEEVFEKWGVIEEGKDHETFKILSTQNRDYGGGVNGSIYGNMFAVEPIHNVVKVYEEWELPTSRYPNGRLIIVTDDHLLHYGPLPEPLGENDTYILPFDVQMSLKTDGFFGRSVVELMIPLQMNYNDIRNRIQDYINRLCIGVLVVEEGAVDDIEELRANGVAPGTIIETRIGSATRPYFMEMQGLPDDIHKEVNGLLEALDRLSGVSQLIKQSVTPTGVTSGVGIAGIQEQDDTRIGLEAENIKNCLMSVGKKWLILYKNNVKFERIVKDIGKGKNGEYEVSQFIGDDLTSFDVYIDTEPEASDTLSQRRQRVVELLNAGLFNDPETGNLSREGRAKVFELLDLGDWEHFTDSENKHQSRALRENGAMVVGNPAYIKDYDDDVIHIAVHNDFRLKAEYDEAVLRNPEIEELFDIHVNEHIQSLQQKTQAEQVNAGTGIGNAGTGIGNVSLPSFTEQKGE
jgi:hypothetical protein